MTRRGVTDALLYAGLTVLFLVSLLASLLAYLDVARLGLDPTRAFEPAANAQIVEPLGEGWWPSITVVGETAPGTYETVTVAARWWLISPLLVIALTVIVVVWRHRRRRTPLPEGADLDDTQPLAVTPGA